MKPDALRKFIRGYEQLMTGAAGAATDEDTGHYRPVLLRQLVRLAGAIEDGVRYLTHDQP